MRASWFAVAVPPVLMLAGVAGAQDKPEAAKPRKAITPLRVQLVFTKHQAEKKVSSLPYVVPCNADDNRLGKVRMGIEVPVPLGASVQYRNVGTNIDCRAEAIEDGRYKIGLDVEQSSIYSPEAAEGRAGKAESWADTALGKSPVFRSFSTSISALLRDGQSSQYTVATDPVSGEVVKVEVTMNVVK